MGAATSQYPRGRAPSRVGVGGRWRDPGVPQVAPGGRWHQPAARQQEAFQSRRFQGAFTISGVTRDAAGVALAGCEVDLFHSASDALVARTVSDGSGGFSFTIGNNSDYFYVRAYKLGSPDVGGTSVNTLSGV